jgi:hypothetical protein
MDNIFNPAAGLAPNLIPNPPADVPEARGAGDAVAGLSPFNEPQDVDQIIKQLMLDRPLKLYIPNRDQYPEYEFRIINSIPQEIADAKNKGWKEVTDEKLSSLFAELVAGTDKSGKAFRPILMGRPKVVGEHVRKRNRQQLQSLYAGMDPSNKDLGGKYTSNVDKHAGTKADFIGPAWRIRV